MHHGAVHAQGPKAQRQQFDDTGLLQLLVERVVDYAIFLLTPDGYVASWNPGAERLKGYTAEEIIGEHFARFYTDEARAAGRPQWLLERARREGRSHDEGWRVRKDGSRFWADVLITALYDHSGQLRGFAKITRDLSERRVAEERLRQSEERFRTLVDSVKDYAIFMLSPDGIVLTWNQGAERLKGYTREEMIGQSFERFYTDEARAAGRPQHLLEIARAEGRVEDEGWRVRKDGSPFWADVVITALRDEHGKNIGFAKVTRDLTERRQAEQERAGRMAAERAAERFERLQVATAALAAASDPRTVAEVLADAAMRAVGATSATVSLQASDGPAAANFDTIESRGDASVPPDMEIPLSLDHRSLGVIGLGFAERRLLDTDERLFLVALGEVGAQALDRARVHAAERAARTEAQAAERLAREETAVVETLHHVSLALSAELDPDRVVQAVTDAARSVTGAEIASFVDSGAATDADQSAYGSYLAVPIVSKSGDLLGTLRLVRREPDVFTERSKRLAAGIAAQAAVAIDNARLYQQVQDAVRTRDEFLAAAAHDLKTPLATTKAVAQLLKNRIDRQQLPGAERLTEGLSRIDRSVERMTGLIDELLDLARMQMGRPLELDLHEVDLSALAGDVLDDHRPNAPRHTLRLVPSDSRIIGQWDPVRIRRALDNLVANAIKYSPAGGEVVVHIDSSSTDTGRVAVVRVTDQGVGIPGADLPYVFERFRRGANVAFIHGTGIGLGITQSIVQQHDGSVSVDSLEGTGSTFTVRLPLK